MKSCSWNGNENKYGLAFESREDLEKHMMYLEAKQKLKERIFELNGNKFHCWDWENVNEKKYKIYKKKIYLDISVSTLSKFFDNWFYLKTAEAAEKLLEEMPEELMMFLSE